MSLPSADIAAFLARIVACPDDPLPRLVFADWLDESGGPAEAAWAEYIRVRDAMRRDDLGGPGRRSLGLRAHGLIPAIGAPRTFDATCFRSHPEPLLEVLPGPGIRLELGGVHIASSIIELIPESVARENLVLPLRLTERALYVVMADPLSGNTVQKLAFILNKDIVAVRADEAAVQEAINRHYAGVETESVDYVFSEFDVTSVVLDYQEADDSDAPLNRLTNLILHEAIRAGATAVDIEPTPDRGRVRHRVGDQWIERDGMPLRLVPTLAERLCAAAGGGLPHREQPSHGVLVFRDREQNYSLPLQITWNAAGPAIHIAIPPANPAG